MMVKLAKILFFVFILQLIVLEPVKAQNYGLGFYGNETTPDRRTSLDLNAGGDICLKDNFEFSFDLAFLPNTADYFGYIFRIITSDNQNIDLIYDRQAPDGKHFNIIVGSRFSKLVFDIPDSTLISKWTRIKLKFDVKANKISINNNGVLLQEPLKLNSGGCYKVLFGINNYQKFETVDAPPMKIRDIRITEGGKLAYNWPLNDNKGTIALEAIHNKAAAIVNPLWIRNKHFEWALLKSVSLKGVGGVAFDKKNEIVYLVGADTIMRYYVKTGAYNGIRSTSKIERSDRGSQSVFEGKSNKIYNVFPEERLFSFDLLKREWSSQNGNSDSRNYSQYNKFYSPADSTIYILGGYGHYTYLNQVLGYHVPQKEWVKVESKGDFFTPRHLAGLGATDKGAYIIGGYGSVTGQQVLNPMNLYDLMFFDVKTKTFKKIYELQHPAEDFSFANSLIIDEKNNAFYGAIFNKKKSHSSLQLISGSLTKPVFDSIAKPLPYPLLKDIHSFADLYYCKVSKEFIMVTLFNDEKANTTQFYIYSLYASPIKAVYETPVASGKGKLIIYLLALLALSVVGGIVYKKVVQKNKQNTPVAVPVKTDVAHNSLSTSTLPNADILPPVSHGINLFGGLQVYDADGNDLTKLLTPLLKEIFLAILVYTIKWKRGISTEKLNELFWFDKTGDSASNNRSVNIAKLKQFLDKLKHASIVKESDYWKIAIDYNFITVDYKQYLDIVKEKNMPARKKVEELAKIISKGSFLAGANYEWIDNFKLETANEIIDAYLLYANSINIADDAEFLIEVANYIFYFDPVNEEAMQIKCKALVHLGKRSLAKYAFEHFCHEYKAIYKENFDKDFQSIIG